MNKESNKYIFLYSIALVVLVAAVLAVASIALKPYQQKNIEVEKQQSILRSVRKAADVKSAQNKAQYIAEEYGKYITSSFIVNSLGEKVDGDAFAVDLEEEMAKPSFERKLPVFVCTDSDSSKKYILPVRGTGLWGPLWGYVAFKDDYNTIFGVVFDHKGETPGLGAEIATPTFQSQFAGKQIFDGAAFTSVQVVKGGNTQGKLHEVDAISGGTITSKGLEDMLKSTLSGYLKFFEEAKWQEKRTTVEVEPVKQLTVRPAAKPVAAAPQGEKPVAQEPVAEQAEEVSSDSI